MKQTLEYFLLSCTVVKLFIFLILIGHSNHLFCNSCMSQGRRKVSNIGEARIKSVAKFPENIGGAQLLTAPNIGGARAPVPPCSYGPVMR